eukprot:SAG22_NODE_98_length_20720_cov_17.226662_10_plen_68_part_00
MADEEVALGEDGQVELRQQVPADVVGQPAWAGRQCRQAGGQAGRQGRQAGRQAGRRQRRGGVTGRPT